LFFPLPGFAGIPGSKIAAKPQQLKKKKNRATKRPLPVRIAAT